jgi:hypothetical protein
MRRSALAAVFAIFLAGLLASVAQAQYEDLYDLYQQRELQPCLDLALPRLDQAPDDRDLNQIIGRCLVEIGRVGEARPYLEKVVNGPIQNDWRYAFAFLNLGIVQWWEGDREGARTTWTIATTDSRLAAVSQNAGVYLKMTGLAAYYADWTALAGEHTYCRFAPDFPANKRTEFVSNADETWIRLGAFFGGVPDRKAEVLVWTDAAKAAKAAGVPMLGYAFANLCVVHTQAGLPLGQHLAPVFWQNVVRPTEAVQFMALGVAEICDGRQKVDRLAEARAALAGSPNANLDIPRWWQDQHALSWDVVKPVSGAFAQALLDHGGQEIFVKFLQTPTYLHAREIYGKAPLDAVIAAFMAKVQPD